jgi:hypothetical protein
MRRVPSPSSSSSEFPLEASLRAALSPPAPVARSRGAFVALALVASAVVTTSTRLAAADDCPPGSWFCGHVAVPGPAGAAAESEKKAADTPTAESDKKATESGSSGSDAGSTPKSGDARKGFSETTITTIGDDGKPTTIVVKSGDKSAAPPPAPAPEPPPAAPAPPPRAHSLPKQKLYGYEPPPATRRRFVPEWGLNGHFQGATLGDKSQAASNAKMGGLGFAIRTRPWGHFAVDFGIDFINGIDYQGNRRQEIPLSLNALWFLNPRSKAQFYFIGGINWSNARVDLPAGNRADYTYFGAQGGAGLEIRFSRRIAMNFDFLGFIRGRTDDGARQQPEFIDPTTGRSTNTSGGGLMRLGLTAYWH